MERTVDMGTGHAHGLREQGIIIEAQIEDNIQIRLDQLEHRPG